MKTQVNECQTMTFLNVAMLVVDAWWEMWSLVSCWGITDTWIQILLLCILALNTPQDVDYVINKHVDTIIYKQEKK